MLCIAYILGLSWNYVDADFISHIWLKEYAGGTIYTVYILADEKQSD